jgi:hypothetical protein
MKSVDKPKVCVETCRGRPPVQDRGKPVPAPMKLQMRYGKHHVTLLQGQPLWLSENLFKGSVAKE